MQSIIQQIFRYGFQSYATVHRLPVHIYKAAASIIQCRTAALGGHIQGCPDGHMQRHWYNSCKHRICPQCAYTQVERWLARQRARLLNCAHFHVIFTMPHGLNTFWRYNRRLMSDFLFRSATETLTELMASAKWLGARPGIIAAQHSWTRTLLLHPHLHCLVTAGGLTDSKWVDSSERFLIPFRVVRAKFSGKLLDWLRKALDRGELVLPPGFQEQQARNLFNKLGRKKWNVHLKETYAHGRGVLIYLSRYLRGGPIGNKRIHQWDQSGVSIVYGRKKAETISLKMAEFFSRYFQHIPRPNEVLVRSYGLYANGMKAKLECCRELLGQPPVEEYEFLEWQDLVWRNGDTDPGRCPVCGKKLIVVDTYWPIPKLPQPETLKLKLPNCSFA